MGFVTNKWQPTSSGPAPVVPVRYGVKFVPTGLTSDTALTYVFDAVGMTSATLSTSGFSWGSWENTLLGKSFYPAVTTDRNLVTSIDYKLDPNDYTKKTDGTASNITSPSGNVVSVFEGGWISIYNQTDNGTTYTYVVWSNVQYDSSYVAFHRLQAGNVLHKGFTVGCYLGSNNSLTATRSLSGSSIYNYTNNPSTNINTNNSTVMTYYQLQYIHYLSMIMFRTIDIHDFSYRSGAQGSQNTNGLFHITVNQNNQNDVKIFGIENLCMYSYKTLIKGLGARMPKITSSATSAQTVAIIYDYSTNAWVDMLSISTVKSTLNNYFTNAYNQTFSKNAPGYTYTSITPSTYGLIPNSFTRTTNSNNELGFQHQLLPSTSAVSYFYASGFYKFTFISTLMYSSYSNYLRYASFID